MLRPARGIPRHFMEVITRMDVIESHGARIPILGFGTMTLKEDVCVQLVEASLKLGHRHLDTAQMYGNEREVGSGMRGSALKREDIFLTTKVWFTRLASGDFERSVDESLERLALPWVDLLMIHWPNAQVPLSESIASLCKMKQAGLTKHIGVANFNVAMIEEAVKLATEPIAVLQIETHPYLDQSKVVAAARRHGMAVVGYCPLARGKCPPTRCCKRSDTLTAKHRRRWRWVSSNSNKSFRSRARPSANGLPKTSVVSICG
jgi:2,5-diketo-D-gluconate reductase B